MEKDWVLIYTTTDQLRIEMLRQVLDDSGVEAVIMNKKDRSYLLGDHELYVNRDSVIKAKSVIKDIIGE
jgi:hypothetical protein